MMQRGLIAAISIALLVLAGCTTDQASRTTTTPAPGQGSQGMQGAMESSQGGGSSGY
ncbi:hypothetical protein [Ensifer sp. MJa1]|uniref:hypothetical protein n=1 Tax=Ensifer sp. MJa1 TaxID=2919888 RepID=UPI00300A7EFB